MRISQLLRQFCLRCGGNDVLCDPDMDDFTHEPAPSAMSTARMSMRTPQSSGQSGCGAQSPPTSLPVARTQPRLGPSNAHDCHGELAITGFDATKACCYS